MPNRILKESICTSESIDDMSWFEECFFHRLLVNCDDYGRFDARPAILKSRLFPLKERLSLKDIEGALKRLADIGCVKLYTCDSKPYLYLPTWEVHQTVRARKSRYPDPNGVNACEIICKQMQADVPVIQSNPNPIRIRDTDSGEQASPPRRNWHSAQRWIGISSHTTTNRPVGKTVSSRRCHAGIERNGRVEPSEQSQAKNQIRGYAVYYRLALTGTGQGKIEPQ